MTKLTDRKLAILAFIEKQVADKGQAPTLAEIAQACGLSSRGAVRKHVQALEADGHLEVAPGQARGVRPKGLKGRSELLSTPLFEVTAADISELDDTDLRELIARLCMAQLSNKGLSSLHVLSGGDQRAADGGIDVQVSTPNEAGINAGFPRDFVGYQVKAMRMSSSAIQNEMCPNGVLRPSIRAIIKAKGAYIIASADNVSLSMYQDRISAMYVAASTEIVESGAKFDFFDSQRIANWTNDHPGVVAWVRLKLGRPLLGWRPYENWAVSNDGKQHMFINDTSPRLRDPTNSNENHSYSLSEGLQEVRSILRRGGASVRIAGLSGVGKTRFAQALFEESSAPHSLDSALALYTDISAEPVPSPQSLLDELLVNKRRAILIVDNCSAELHRLLTVKCRSSTNVSLLTIEYDIREDVPEVTDVFSMESASSELIASVIEQQFPNVSEVDAATITHFSNGNSRVAIALASTLEKGDSLIGMRNDELFRRLFWQKHSESQMLLRAASSCALLYSFDGVDEKNELPRLAEIAGMGVLDIYREISTLINRGLAQRRGVWRAILPHAIANILAKQALTDTPYSLIAKQLVDGKGRLFLSFSRRLGYLHDSKEAVNIVRQWLSEGGIIGDVTKLGELSQVLRNIAPVDPEAVLVAIERAIITKNTDEFFSTQNYSRHTITSLVRSIAWDKDYFERCMAILVKFAMAEPDNYNSNSTKSIITSLFQLRLSGTNATSHQRAEWIKSAIISNDEKMQRLALECLNSTLKSRYLSSSYIFDFGTRHRDYGYTPIDVTEIISWFDLFVKLALELGTEQTKVGAQAKHILATNFRSLWSDAHLYDLLEYVTQMLLPIGWESGWLAIRMTLNFDGKDMLEATRSRLINLERALQPSTLVEQTRAIVLTAHSSGLDITDGDDSTSAVDSYQNADNRAIELGQKVAKDHEAFEELLPSLVENNQGRYWKFGYGLAQGAVSPDEMWLKLVTAFKAADPKSRNIQVLNGFLCSLFLLDRKLFEQLLDAAMDIKTIADWVPVLQASVKLDSVGWDRLLRTLVRGDAPAERYQYLAYGRVTNDLSDVELASLLRELARKNNGVFIALDILSMHLHDYEPEVTPVIKSLGRELLSQIPLAKNQHRLDYSLKLIIDKCLIGPDAVDSAKDILSKIRKGLNEFYLSAYDFNYVFESLFSMQPIACLDELIGSEPDVGVHYIRRRDLESLDRQNPLSKVPIEILLEWCKVGSSQRWTNLATAIPAFVNNAEEETPISWSEAAIMLIQNAPNKSEVLQVLVDRITPSSWSGSRAKIMSERLPLFDQLSKFLAGDDLTMFVEHKSLFQSAINLEMKREKEYDRDRNDRFE